MSSAGLVYRRGRRQDLDAVAALLPADRGDGPAAWTDRLREAVERGDTVLVAEQDGEVVGYARAGRRVPTGPDDAAPAGWYLTGAAVAEDRRREGVARHLLALLLAEIGAGGEQVWSCADARDAASLALHEGLGFVEVLRAPELLGVAFTGGEGVLLRRGGGEDGGPPG